ncbi:hypothetical protein ACSSS7_006645 [Eimeria intestinalis]
MTQSRRHVQPGAKVSVAVLALLGLALSPGSTLELHKGPSSPSQQPTMMMYPSIDGPPVFVEDSPDADDTSPLVPQGEGEDVQQSEGPISPENEGRAGQQQQQQTPVSFPKEGQAAQQEAPKRSRAARVGAGLKRAILYIPRQLRKFYHKVKRGTRNLWARMRARFGRRRRQQPEGPPARPLRRGRAATYGKAAPERRAEGRRRTASVGGLPRDLSSPWGRPPSPPAGARLLRRRSASFGLPPPEAPPRRRSRAASLGGGMPGDLSSPWSAPARREEVERGGEGMMPVEGEVLGSPEEGIGPLGEKKKEERESAFGGGRDEGKGGEEGAELPLPPSTASTGPSEGEEEGLLPVEGGGAETGGVEGFEGGRPGEQPTAAAGGPEEEEAGAVGGEERGGGAAAAPAELAPAGGNWPVRISPLEFPLADVVITGEMKALSANAHHFPFLFRALFLNHELRTAGRLSILLPSNQITPRLTIKDLEGVSPAALIDGALAIGLENAYRTANNTTNSLWILARWKVALILPPTQMLLLDQMMTELALALHRLEEARGFADARAIVSQMKVDFSRIARKLKTFMPILIEALRKGQEAAEREQEAMIDLIDSTNALIARHQSTPSSNTYAHGILIPGLKIVGGRAACDLIRSRLLATGLQGLEKMLEKQQRAMIRWLQSHWVANVAKLMWNLRDPTRVADKITIEACNDYTRQRGTQDESIFPWFARLPHITERKLLVE